MSLGQFSMYFVTIFTILIICLFCIFLYTRKTLIIDPGLLHVIVLVISVGSMFAAYILHYKDLGHAWLLWSVDGMIDQILYINTLYVVFFTFFYILLLKIFGRSVNAQFVYISNIKMYRLEYFVLVYVGVLIISQFIGTFSLTYIQAYWQNVVDIAFLAVLALSLNMIKSTKWIIFFSIIAIFYLMLIHYPLLNTSEQYIVNRGGATKLVIFALVFLDITREKKIFTASRLFLGLLLLPIILGFASYFELIMNGYPASMRNFMLYVSSGYELRMMENQAIVLSHLETGNIIERSGATYIYALKELYSPFENLQKSPSQWFAEYLGGDKSQYAFSFIAEGIMNYGRNGAIIAALIGASVLYLVRSTLRLQWFMSPFLYASLITLPYYVYRSDLQLVLKKIQFSLYSFALIIMFYIILKVIVDSVSKKRVSSI